MVKMPEEERFFMPGETTFSKPLWYFLRVDFHELKIQGTHVWQLPVS